MYDLAKCLSIVIVTHQYLQVVNEWGFLTSPHHGLDTDWFGLEGALFLLVK